MCPLLLLPIVFFLFFFSLFIMRLPCTPTAQALTDIKNVITQFFLNPTLDNLFVMHQRYRYYANTDGNRGKAAMVVLAYSVGSFNLALADAMLRGRLQ